MVSMGATDQRDQGEDLTFILNVRREYLLTAKQSKKNMISAGTSTPGRAISVFLGVYDDQ